MIRPLQTAIFLCAVGCGAARTDPPPVEPSSPEAATTIVRISQGTSFTQPCLIVQTGATVEWRNLTPLSPIDVVSTAAPFEVSSPALLSPYDEVPPEQSDECAKVNPDNGTCAEPLAYSYWRHTFSTAGVFDYFDSVGAAVAQQPVSGEYGMPAGPTTAMAATGTICVLDSMTSNACSQVCCMAIANQCASGVSCVSGRCGGVTLPPGGSL